jgi:membrane fusion protein, multidrug efflux system
VKLTLRRPEATVWVPASSVVRAQSGMFVLQVADGRVHRVPVTEGIRRDTLQEVFGQIAPGDTVVRKGTEELEDNSPVN